MCVLSVCSKGADLQGDIDAEFEIDVVGGSAAATILYAKYVDTKITAAPFQFKVVKGWNVLTIVVDGTTDGNSISWREITNGCNQELDRFTYISENPTDGLEIMGL